MKPILQSIRMLIFMTILTGIGYPFLMTAIGAAFFREQADGSMLQSSDVILGSRLVAQEFKTDNYFWSRPSGGANFNPLPSGGTNLGPTSADLKKSVADRITKLKIAHPDEGEPPQDLYFSSGSGLDPEISPEAAHYQIRRVAKTRGMNIPTVESLVARHTFKPQFGILGEPRVHVLALNIALDEAQGIKIHPQYIPDPPKKEGQ